MLWVRYFVVSGGAAAMALFLFFAMFLLIDSKASVVINEYEAVKVIDFIRPKKNREYFEEEEELPEKKEVLEQPPAPEMDMEELTIGSGSDSHRIVAPTPEEPKPDIQITKGFDVLSAPYDTDIIPLVRVQPMYPPSAAQQRIEGWVILEFTVTQSGGIKNPKVVDFYPSDIFNQAALQAIRKWKYKPRIVKGKKISSRGVQIKLTFQLE